MSQTSCKTDPHYVELDDVIGIEEFIKNLDVYEIQRCTRRLSL